MPLLILIRFVCHYDTPRHIARYRWYAATTRCVPRDMLIEPCSRAILLCHFIVYARYAKHYRARRCAPSACLCDAQHADIDARALRHCWRAMPRLYTLSHYHALI